MRNLNLLRSLLVTVILLVAAPAVAGPCNPYKGCNPNLDPSWPVYLTGPGSSVVPSPLAPDVDKYRSTALVLPRAPEMPLDEPALAAVFGQDDEMTVVARRTYTLEASTQDAVPVPEPAIGVLLAAASAALLYRRK